MLATEQPDQRKNIGALYWRSPDYLRQLRPLRVLQLVFVVGAILRLVIWLTLGASAPTVGDAKDYNLLAVSLVQYGEFAITPGAPSSLRPPLYPVIVAGIYRLFGIENWQAIGTFQALLSLGTAWLVYRLAKEAYSDWVGVLAGTWACFYPSLLAYNRLVLTEVLFTFLLCACLLTLVLALKRDSLAMIAGAGVLLGLAALTRSVVWLFPLPLAVYLVCAISGSAGRRMASALVLMIVFALTIAPWSIRNSLLQKTFVAVDVMGGRNLMMGNYEHTPLFRAWDAISLEGEQGWVHALQPELAKAPAGTQGRLDKVAMRYGVQFMLSHPGLTLDRSLIKFIDFWQLEREVVADAQRSGLGASSQVALLSLALLVAGSYAAAIFAGLFGGIVVPPADWRIHALILLFIGYVCGMHTIVFGHSRYHLPLMPLVFVYSAGAIAHASVIWRQRRSIKCALAGTLCVLLMASWAWELFWVDPKRYLSVLQ
jgi:4-amino-4-deoxy-L-arabinose transferase-like glycosyltransferase